MVKLSTAVAGSRHSGKTWKIRDKYRHFRKNSEWKKVMKWHFYVENPSNNQGKTYTFFIWTHRKILENNKNSGKTQGKLILACCKLILQVNHMFNLGKYQSNKMIKNVRRIWKFFLKYLQLSLKVLLAQILKTKLFIYLCTYLFIYLFIYLFFQTPFLKVWT